MRRTLMVLAALSLAACANRQVELTPGHLIGAALGGAAGGILGYQFGGGLGQILATAAGSAVGAGAGYMVGPRLMPGDQVAHDRTAERTLAAAPDGAIQRWDNPETGARGIFRATRSFRAAQSGLYCRDYRSTAVVRDGTVRDAGTACQMADGRWILFARAPG